MAWATSLRIGSSKARRPAAAIRTSEAPRRCRRARTRRRSRADPLPPMLRLAARALCNRSDASMQRASTASGAPLMAMNVPTSPSRHHSWLTNGRPGITPYAPSRPRRSGRSSPGQSTRKMALSIGSMPSRVLPSAAMRISSANRASAARAVPPAPAVEDSDDRHAIAGQGAGLVDAEHGRRAKRFDRLRLACQHVLPRQAPGTERQHHRPDDRELFGNDRHGQRQSDQEPRGP